MSTTATNIDTVVAAASAALRTLPAADVTPGAPLTGAAGLATAIPGAGAKAATATLAGSVGGTIVLVVSAELAQLLENGPVPQELLAGLTPSLNDATAALGGDVRCEAAQVIDADVALATTAEGEDVVVVPFNTSDGTPVASLVLIFEDAQPVASPDSAQFEALSQTLTGGVTTRAVELLNDVEMGVTAELGRTRMTVRELLSLQLGSIVELDRAAGSPVDLLVNGTLVARGEVVVIDEEFGIRITEIIGYEQKKSGS